jgi:hypothetical protein
MLAILDLRLLRLDQAADSSKFAVGDNADHRKPSRVKPNCGTHSMTSLTAALVNRKTVTIGVGVVRFL